MYTGYQYRTMEHEKVDDDMDCQKAKNKECRKVDDGMEHEIVGDDEFTPLSPIRKSKRDMEIINLVRDIALPFVPAKALVKFRSVSKDWDRWISNPFLAHQQSYYFKELSGFFCQHADLDPTFVTLNNIAYGVPMPSLRFLPKFIKIISSCNGLLLCHGLDENDLYYICNPATQEWTALPRPQLYHGTKSAAVLAFEPSALNMEAHYQLICGLPNGDHVYFEMYCSKTESWKISETALVEMEGPSLKGNGVYMKGVVYLETSTRKVVAFHLSSHLYEIISLPPGTPPDGVLTFLQGELCYISISCLLKNDYSIVIYSGFDLSLKHRLDVKMGPESNCFPQYRVLPCLDGSNVMILMGSGIYSYSISDQSIKAITRVEIESVDADNYLAYVNSLAPVAKPLVSGY